LYYWEQKLSGVGLVLLGNTLAGELRKTSPAAEDAVPEVGCEDAPVSTYRLWFAIRHTVLSFVIPPCQQKGAA
jgi:hypothetical protein